MKIFLLILLCIFLYLLIGFIIIPEEYYIDAEIIMCVWPFLIVLATTYIIGTFTRKSIVNLLHKLKGADKK